MGIEQSISKLGLLSQFRHFFSSILFGFRQWQSIRQLRDFYGFQPIEVIFDNAKKRFYHELTNHCNSTLRFLSSLEL